MTSPHRLDPINSPRAQILQPTHVVMYEQPNERKLRLKRLLTLTAPTEPERLWFEKYLSTPEGVNRIDEIGGNVLMYYFLYARPPLPEAITYLI